MVQESGQGQTDRRGPSLGGILPKTSTSSWHGVRVLQGHARLRGQHRSHSGRGRQGVPRSPPADFHAPLHQECEPPVLLGKAQANTEAA